jgi:hypothetical protein
MLVRRTASPAHADFGGLRSGAVPVVVRLDVVSFPPRSSAPTVAGCRLGGYPVGHDRWGGKRAAVGMSEDNDRCFSTLVLGAFSTGRSRTGKGSLGGGEEGGGVRSGPGAVRTILLFHIISARPSK